jgi:hypothetical protein
MSDADEPAPKIIVDSDWKEQVAKEKAAATEAESVPPPDEPSQSKTVSVEDSAPGEMTPEDLPAAGLEHIVSVFFTQALMYLGQMPGADDKPLPVNKPMAKHVIDSIEALSEKTKGNTTDEEASMLNGVLHALRMAYVNAK